MFRSLTILILLLSTACGPARVNERPPVTAEQDTTLGVGDVFDVRVFGEDELTGEYRVAPDGSINFPLVGRIDVIGLEPHQVAVTIRDQLRDGEFLREPQVSVFVQEYNSKRVSVMGAVERAGSFPIQPGMTLVNAISLAGGFTALARRSDVAVSRQIDGEVRRFTVDVDEITSGREDDFPIRGGDIVYVQERVF